MGKLEFDTLLVQSARIPMVKIDRELFLRKELKDRFDKEIVDKAVEYNPAYAGITVNEINKIAKSCITAETRKVTLLSAASGIPGGFAMIGTVPADLVQYYAHVLRILQKLTYLYGWKDFELDSKEMSDETKNLLTLFIGIMFGVNGASTAISKISSVIANQVAKKLPQKALTKGVVYPIVKKVATFLGVHMTKEAFSKGVSKAIPVVGAIASGGLTYVTFKPMAKKLKEYLASSDLAKVETYKGFE